MEKLRFAIAYGADAVYLAGESFGLRAAAANFSPKEMAAAFAMCRENGVKAYVAVNIFAHNRDIAALEPYLETLRDMKPAGLIVSDLGVFSLAREVAPSLPLHISTQANTVNWKTASTWQEMGARRVVLGRELSLAEMKEIRERTDVELEIFVHGAMCMAYSGRCLLSNYLASVMPTGAPAPNPAAGDTGWRRRKGRASIIPSKRTGAALIS